MVRLIDSGIVQSADLPWLWTTLITCPRCSAQWYLTAEDTMPGIVNRIGPTGTLALGWRQLVEGDPASAAIDTANLHIDPAQVVGQCPNCGYNPVVQRGPRYGQTKITLTTPINTSAIQGYIARGAVAVLFIHSSEGWLVGIFANADNTPFLLDPTQAYAAAARRTRDGTIDAVTPFGLHAPSIGVHIADARATDDDLVTTLERFGLRLID